MCGGRGVGGGAGAGGRGGGGGARVVCGRVSGVGLVEGGSGSRVPGMAGPAGETRRKARGEKSRLCLHAAAVAASSLQRWPSIRVATWTN